MDRLASIDRVRGLVIVLMVLDHTRDYFQNLPYSATDLTRTDVPLFFTRWITHLCAPTFVFLAGVSAHFVGKKLDRAGLRRFLLTRGLWLVLLELTVVRFMWTFDLGYRDGIILQVIWALGASMCCLAALCSLDRRLIAALALIMIAGHDTLDVVTPADFGAWAELWNVLHVAGRVSFGRVVYPLVPWIGVMALGYAMGSWFERADRRRWWLRFGLGSLALFCCLRGLDVYGDPRPWQWQPRAGFTALSFLNVSKYPPSLLYVLLTLGITFLLLAALDTRRTVPVLMTFGRVPLFAYVVHIGMVHLSAGLLALALGFGTAVLFDFFESAPAGWGFGLGVTYLAWLLTLAVLWPMCRWFAGVKARHHAWWLAYL